MSEEHDLKWAIARLYQIEADFTANDTATSRNDAKAIVMVLEEIERGRASPTPPTTEGREEAREIVNFNPLHDGDFDDEWAEKAQRVARALLSSPRVEEIEAAMLKYMVANNVGGSVLDILTVGSPYLRISRDVLRNALAYALSPPDGDGKQEQATRAEDGPTAPTDRL